MVVPPKHPKMIIFSRKTHGCWVPPFKETTIYGVPNIEIWKIPPIICRISTVNKNSKWPQRSWGPKRSEKFWGFDPILVERIILLLVVSTHLESISQNGNLPQMGVKIINIWNHHLDSGPTTKLIRTLLSFPAWKRLSSIIFPSRKLRKETCLDMGF